MSERQLKAFKGAKIWNMVLLIFSAIGVVSSLISLPVVLNPEIYKQMGTPAALEIYKLFKMPLYKGYVIFSLVLTAVLLILFILAHLKLRKNKMAPDFPYFIYIGTEILGVIFSVMTNMQGTIGIYTTIGATIIGCFFPVMVLVNLSKAEKANKE